MKVLLTAIIFGFSRLITGETSGSSVTSVSSRANDFWLLSISYSFVFESASGNNFTFQGDSDITSIKGFKIFSFNQGNNQNFGFREIDTFDFKFIINQCL